MTPAPVNHPPAVKGQDMARITTHPRIKFSRDTVLLLSGLFGVFYQMRFAHTIQPTLLVIFAGWTVSPLVLRADEAKTKAGDRE